MARKPRKQHNNHEISKFNLQVWKRRDFDNPGKNLQALLQLLQMH